MASSLIYLIIIGMWVAYFLPRWITSHEEVSGRSAERAKSAMKSVTENDRPNFRPEIVEPDLKRKIIARRRIIFSILATSFLGTLVVVTVGAVAWSLLFIPLSALAIYSVSVRRQIIATQLRTRRLNALKQITAAEIKLEPTERITFARERSESAENWVPLTERLDTAGVVVIPRERQSWQPISVPKPTYASAPKAITPKRIIDLTVPGTWQEEEILLEAFLLPSREDIFDQELAEQAAVEHLEVRESKAVND
jgi:hypothetical protein